MAEHLTMPKLGVLTQGTFFSCATAEDYAGCHVDGLVITASCDIAQHKAAVFNYLPVVALDDWIHRDGRLLLCDRVAKNIEGRMRSCLKAAGYSDSVMKTQTPHAILQTLFPANAAKKEVQKQRKGFLTAVQDHGDVATATASEPHQKLVVAIGKKHEGHRDALLRELISHQLNGYYFVPSISVGQEALGHVVLLREVRHMPRDLATYVAEGMTAEEYKKLCQSRRGFVDRLSFDKEDFAMPVGLMRSPHMEHLMQAFSILFSRIGLPDPDPAYMRSVWEKQPSVGDGQ